MNAPTHAAYRATKRFTAVDGLRGVAIFLVIAYHVDPHGFGLDGLEGITAFLLLSGYLLTTLSLREEARYGRLAVGAFYVRRAYRILPAYIVVLGGLCVLILGLGIGGAAEPFRDALPYYLTYTNEFSLTDTLPMSRFSHSWSLGIQEKFYVVWPLLGFVLWRTARRRVLGSLGILVLALSLGVLFGELWITTYGVIMAGCLIAIALHERRGFHWFSWLGLPWGGVFALVFLLAVHVAIRGLPDPAGQALLMVPVVLLLAGVVMCGNGGWAKPLTWGPLGWVGRRAYGVYLLHSVGTWTAQRLLPDSAHSVLVVVLATVITVIAAGLLYRFVEAPLLARGRDISKRMRARASEQEREAAASAGGRPADPAGGGPQVAPAPVR